VRRDEPAIVNVEPVRAVEVVEHDVTAVGPAIAVAVALETTRTAAAARGGGGGA
jgi:hypothetical protein